MKKKILYSVLFVVVLLITVFTIKVSAYTVENGNNSYDFGNIDVKNHVIVFIDSYNEYVYLDTFDDYSLSYLADTRYRIDYVGDNNGYRYNLETQVVSQYSRNNLYSVLDTEYELIYLDVDLVDNNNNVVFQKAPVKAETIVAQALEETEMSTVLQEIVKIIPLTMVAVVSFLGLRKGLTLLFQIFHKA